MIKEENVIIESMRVADLYEVLKIEQVSFSDPWPYSMFVSELSDPLAHLWVARDISGVLRGYICFWLIEDEAHILNLAIDPLYRRKGIGSMLITTSLEYWKKFGIKGAYLEVRESNKGARRIYDKFGFRVIMCKPQYYKNPGEDAYVMGLDI